MEIAIDATYIFGSLKMKRKRMDAMKLAAWTKISSKKSLSTTIRTYQKKEISATI